MPKPGPAKPKNHWVSPADESDAGCAWKYEKVRRHGMIHTISLPVSDPAPLVRGRKLPLPEWEAAAQAGVPHGGSITDLQPGNPGGPPWTARDVHQPWPEDKGVKNRVNPDRKETEPFLSFPHSRQSCRLCWTRHRACAQPWCRRVGSGISCSVSCQRGSASRTT